MLPPASLRPPADSIGPRAQRTIGRIIEATREVFLAYGYSGTTIDEIARVAKMSRASVYTYFPSKREVLLAVGENAVTESLALVARLADEGTSRAALSGWVADYFAFLDVHGAFAFAWTQAARTDEEIRVAGMRGHLRICRRLGRALTASAGRTTDHPAALGVVASSMLERAWNYGQLYADALDRNELTAQVVAGLWGLARQPSPPRS